MAVEVSVTMIGAILEAFESRAESCHPGTRELHTAVMPCVIKLGTNIQSGVLRCIYHLPDQAYSDPVSEKVRSMTWHVCFQSK